MGHNFWAGLRTTARRAPPARPRRRPSLMALRPKWQQQLSQCSSTGSRRWSRPRPAPPRSACPMPTSTCRRRRAICAALRSTTASTCGSIGAAQVDGLVATVTLPAGVIANALPDRRWRGMHAGRGLDPGFGSIGSLAPQASRSITLNLTGTQAGFAGAARRIDWRAMTAPRATTVRKRRCRDRSRGQISPSHSRPRCPASRSAAVPS